MRRAGRASGPGEEPGASSRERSSRVRVHAGGELHVLEAGPEDGVPVVVHHGTPGSAGFLDAWVDDAERRGLRLVATSRPGYDGSVRCAERDVAEAAHDLADVLDVLGLDRFTTWGWSGGGPHALACAALLPERAVAVATLAGVAPYDGEGLSWLEGMGPGNVEEFGAAAAGEEALRALLEAQVPELLGTDVEGFVAAMRPFCTPVDERALGGELGPFWLEGIRRGLADGVDGWVDDDLAFVRPWGFAVEDVPVPWLLLQGRQDAMVPGAHGEWLAGRAPRGTVEVSDADGHLTLLTDRVPDVHGWLLDRWREAAGAAAG